MDWKARAQELLDEFNACCRARPYKNALDVEIAKDACAKFAHHLNTQKSWGTDNDIAEACYQLEPRLKKFKETVVMDILKDGSI
jgi:hypothetical protein